MKEPKRTTPKPAASRKPLGKPKTVTYAPQKYDNVPPPAPPISDDEAREGFKRLPPGPLTSPRKRKFD